MGKPDHNPLASEESAQPAFNDVFDDRLQNRHDGMNVTARHTESTKRIK